MKIDFAESGNDILFKITDYGKYEDAIKMCFYQKDEDAYVKKFSKSINNIDKIMNHYKKYAEEMFSQVSYFSEIPWEDALYEFVKRVDGAGINWWLVGSCAACIRGIKMNPHDVDIMMDSKDVDKINKLFEDCIIEPIVDTNGWLTKDFGVLFLYARIDIATDPSPCLDDPIPVDCGIYARNNLEEVMWQGYKIKVPPVELQINANRIRSRDERVKMLEEYLNANSF